MSILNKIIEKYGVEKLNTLTKYPSILTYHGLGEKGRLVENLVEGKNCSLAKEIDLGILN